MYALIAISLLCLFLSGCQTSNENDTPPELQAYLDEIRSLGMTEFAYAHLRTVASIISGQSILEFIKKEQTGYYTPKYISTVCPSPGTSEEELKNIRDESKRVTDKMIKRIRPLVDADTSGFITTEEATNFRRLYEFGPMVLFIVAEEGPHVELIRAGVNLPKEDFVPRLNEYNLLADKAAELGVQGFTPINRQSIGM